MAKPDYTTTDLSAYWLLTGGSGPGSQSTDPVTGTYVETAQLGVPHTFPAVKPGDLITVADRIWQIDGHPVDYSLGPFTEQWVALTGAEPATVIHLRRAVNVIEGGS